MCCFVIFLYKEVYLKARLFTVDHGTCLGHVRELFSRRAFSENGAHKIEDMPLFSMSPKQNKMKGKISE